MIIRKAQIEDIPYLVDAIISIEECKNSDTFSNLFGCNSVQTKEYLKSFFLDNENLDNEFSLNSYIIAEIDNEYAGSASLIKTNADYYQNKSDLYPIHLQKEHLLAFINNVKTIETLLEEYDEINNVKTLPTTKNTSDDLFFIEYIFVNQKYRGKGIANKLIDEIAQKNKLREVYLNVMDNNLNAINAYKKIGFKEYKTVEIDTIDNTIFPSITKKILRQKYFI